MEKQEPEAKELKFVRTPRCTTSPLLQFVTNAQRLARTLNGIPCTAQAQRLLNVMQLMVAPVRPE